jgi:isoleucyl-tRNA synthetase
MAIIKSKSKIFIIGVIIIYIQIDVDFIKGEDILDIWFDSGVSWATVLPGNYNNLLVKGILSY